MDILDFVDRFSFKQILSTAIVLAIVFAIPTTVWLVNQQTKLYSAAHKENLPPGYFVEEEPFGQPSKFPPKIDKITPFLGKVDDVVLIWGRNFGQNPMDRAIWFGTMQADPKDILKWHDDVIEVMVPEGATSGLVKVVEVGKEDTYELPFTIYNAQTEPRVFWQDNNLAVEKCLQVALVRAVLSGGQTLENKIEQPKMVTTLLPNMPSHNLLNLALYDKDNQLISFWANPADFGF